jgi:hypothetical protein
MRNGSTSELKKLPLPQAVRGRGISILHADFQVIWELHAVQAQILRYN